MVWSQSETEKNTSWTCRCNLCSYFIWIRSSDDNTCWISHFQCLWWLRLWCNAVTLDLYCSISNSSVCLSYKIFFVVRELATVTMAWKTFHHTYQVWNRSKYLILFLNSLYFSEVLKRPLTCVWLCWILIVPIWLFGMLAIAIRTANLISYESFVYPLPFQIVGYFLTSLAPLSILLYFIYYQCNENNWAISFLNPTNINLEDGLEIIRLMCNFSVNLFPLLLICVQVDFKVHFSFLRYTRERYLTS